MSSGEIEKRSIVGLDDAPSPAAHGEVAESGWRVAGAIPAVGLGEDPLGAWAAPFLEFGDCVRDFIPGGEALGEHQTIFEGHRGTFSNVGRRRVGGVPDEQDRSAVPPIKRHLLDRGDVHGVVRSERERVLRRRATQPMSAASSGSGKPINKTCCPSGERCGNQLTPLIERLAVAGRPWSEGGTRKPSTPSGSRRGAESCRGLDGSTLLFVHASPDPAEVVAERVGAARAQPA